MLTTTRCAAAKVRDAICDAPRFTPNDCTSGDHHRPDTSCVPTADGGTDAMMAIARATVRAPRWGTAAALLAITSLIVPRTIPAVMPAILTQTDPVLTETILATAPAILARATEFTAILMPLWAGSPSRALHPPRFWPHLTPAHRSSSDPSLTTKHRISSLTAGNRR